MLKKLVLVSLGTVAAVAQADYSGPLTEHIKVIM
jgi:hypothetical protein